MKIKSFVGIPFILVCALIVSGQRQQSIKPTPKEQARAMAEVVRLRDEYIEATKEYKASLQKLLTLYQDSVLKAEERVNQSQKLFSENLLSKGELERSEKALADIKQKVIGVEQQITNADAQIAETLKKFDKPENITALVRQYRQASVRHPTCRNWTLTASRQQRGRTVTVAFKFICRY